MGYSLDFGWLAGAAGVIARGAAMTLLLIAVTTFAGTFLSILGAAGKR
ncbi:MAG: amino acid ABC transporter permease, partial [Mesorhizobium sp.]